MKMNISLMKLTIRLLILMIFFVLIYLISMIIFSSRYWPDVYNYINAEITIKRIPTLSELNLTMFEVDVTTESYPNTTDDYNSSTVEGLDIDIDEFTNIHGDFIEVKRKTKRNSEIEKFDNDYNVLPSRSVVVDYLMVEDTTFDEGVVWKRIVKDLVDESKLVPKNLGDIEMVNKLNGARLQKLTSICHGNTSDVTDIFPWIATIFIKNDSSNNQFQYTCDGALLSDKLIVTAARCVNYPKFTASPDDVLVFLGKRSLQNVAEDERNVRVSQIITHGNFSKDGKVSSDLALLVLDKPVSFSGSIRPACLGNGDDLKGKTATSAWNVKGDLTPVFFESNKNDKCDEQNEGDGTEQNEGDGTEQNEGDGTEQNEGDGTFCATYGNEVALCPSYGGVFAAKQASRWYLRGIRSGDTTDRGLCFTKHVLYTPLGEYLDWIMQYME